ncbi:MAG: anti-sigma factor [Rhizobiales bacterium]|nr:anti-sigma factor [Hyphomicrobiales bacterium]
MAYSDDHIALAAEYALGTLDTDERALVETMMIVDPGFKAMVEGWSFKLAPLYQMVAPVEPPADVWDRIKASADFSRVQVPVMPPEAPSSALASAHVQEPEQEAVPTPATVTAVASDPVVPPVQDDQPARTESKSGTSSFDAARGEALAATPTAPASSAAQPPAERVEPRPAAPSAATGGYGFGLAMAAVAAVLAAVIALQLYRSEWLPEPLRVEPKVQVVEVPAAPAPASAQWVAALQQNAADPAFILTVDPARKTLTARRVGAAPVPGKSYELWIVSDKLPQPRSLGVIADNGFTASGVLADYDTQMISRAVYAVTVERQGGSNGVPTSNPIYAGKLVESAPGKDAR